MGPAKRLSVGGSYADRMVTERAQTAARRILRSMREIMMIGSPRMGARFKPGRRTPRGLGVQRRHPDRRGACHRAALRADPLAPSGRRLQRRAHRESAGAHASLCAPYVIVAFWTT